jgi:hypothetical protein
MLPTLESITVSFIICLCPTRHVQLLRIEHRTIEHGTTEHNTAKPDEVILCKHNPLMKNAKPLCIRLHRKQRTKKKRVHTPHKIPVQNHKPSIFLPFHHLLWVALVYTHRAKEIVTRVGFEPTPFRTSVLDVM